MSDAAGTWPDRIYLQREDPDYTYPATGGEVTWCDIRIHEYDIEYARADLAPSPAPITKVEAARLAVAFDASHERLPSQTETQAFLAGLRAAQRHYGVLEQADDASAEL
jgi:hypothetical protein